MIFPCEIEVHKLRAMIQLGLDLLEAHKQRLPQINELDELRHNILHQTIVIQYQCVRWHDNFIKNKKFKFKYLALLFDSKFKYYRGKFYIRWLGQYEIDTICDIKGMNICTINEEINPLLANGHRLHLYH